MTPLTKPKVGNGLETVKRSPREEVITVRCKILKGFPYSIDGFTSLMASAGEERDIPDRLVPGLAEAGYVEEIKALKAAPENKMEVEPAPENKATAPRGGRGRRK